MFTIFFLINYLNQYAMYFSHPYSWRLMAMIELHDYICYYMLVVSVFVIIFFTYSIFSFLLKDYFFQKARMNDYIKYKIYKFSHAPYIEWIWIAIPFLFLLLIALPSFRLLYALDKLDNPILTVIIYGNQWYWTYEYSNYNIVSSIMAELQKINYIEFINTYIIDKNVKKHENLQNNFYFINYMSKMLRTHDDVKIVFDSIILTDEDLPLGYPRLLAVDQVLLLPMFCEVRLLMTSNDVIHSRSLPAYGIKMDAVPGRINQVPFEALFVGTSWGQCSELCGINHGFMPIEIRTLKYIDFNTYIRLHLSIKLDKFIPIVLEYMKNFNINIQKLK